MTTSIHAFVQQRRQGQGLDQQQFADALGVPLSTVEAWEKPRGLVPSRIDQRRIALVLDVSMGEFMAVLALTRGFGMPPHPDASPTAQLTTFNKRSMN